MSASPKNKKTEKLKVKIVDLLKDQRDGIHVNDFWSLYQKKYKVTPNKADLGVSRLSEVFDLFPDTFETKVVGSKTSFCLVDTQNKPSTSVTKSESKKSYSSQAKKDTGHQSKGPAVSGDKSKETSSVKTVPRIDTKVSDLDKCALDSLRNEVLELLEENPSGLKFTDFWDLYQRKHQLNPKRLPKPKNFGVASKSGLLNLFSESFESKVHKEVTYIRPKGSMSGWYYDRSANQGNPAPYPNNGSGPRHYAIPSLMQTRGQLDPRAAPAAYGHTPGYGTPFAPTQNTGDRGAPDQYRDRSRDRDSSRSRRDDRHHGYSSASSSSYSGHQQRGRAVTYVPRDQIDAIATDCIERLAESKEYVSAERIEKLLLEHYTVSALSDIGVRNVEDIKCVNEHVRMQCKVNAYIQAFVTCRSMGTFHELHEHMKDFVPDKQEFDKLQLGPLTKQPLVFKFFQIPPSGEFAEINTSNILEYLKEYLTEKNAWTEKNNQLTDFLAYMVEKRGLSDPYELGIRMRSLPLAIQVLKKAQRDNGQTFRIAVDSQRQCLKNDLNQAFQQFHASIMQKEPGICIFRQVLANLQPIEVVCHIFTRVITLYNTIDSMEPSAILNRKKKKKKETTTGIVQQFLNVVAQDAMLARLFQYSVCTNEDAYDEHLKEVMAIQENNAAGSSTPEVALKQKPRLDDIVSLTIKFLENCLFAGSLSLNHLTRIETKLLEKYGFDDFTAMTGETFLYLLLNNPSVKKFMNDSGGSFLGIGAKTNETSESSSYHINFQDLLGFILQTGVGSDDHQLLLLENALCNHFGVKEVSSLGHGSAKHLYTASQRHTQVHKDTTIVYESALVAKTSTFTRNRQTGVLGHQTKDKALSVLQNCPLLEELSDWSHWDLVFQPELGSVKDFIQKYGGVHQSTVTGDNNLKMQMKTDVMALETEPGRLLRITTEASPEKVANAAMEGSVRALCGYLVSLIVFSKGIENTPLALIANHIKIALLKMQATSVASIAPGAPGFGNQTYPAAEFVLDCLTMLPKTTSAELANKVFLEPLSQAIGHSKSKDVLLSCIKTETQKLRLQYLGMVLGVQPWIDDFLPTLKPPHDCLEKMEVLDLGQGQIITIDDESDLDEDDNDEINDSPEFLSDVEPETNDQNQMDTAVLADKLTNAKEKKPTVVEIMESENDSDVIEIIDGKTDEDGDEAESSVDERRREFVIVEKIRREEFGVGVELSEDGKKLMIKQQERQGRSLDRLSRDLYSKDTHFVLELIQNADDNGYPEKLSCPTVQFVVDKDCISVYNNECGFEEKNIRALCDVGQSTKGKHKFGYIGQKGIGFKSVFRVTDRPEVHSRGYHICFDVNSGPMGYILPHWIDPPDMGDNIDWTTCIKLPLKESMQTQGQTGSLVARFHDVHPSLLLFLHRLRKLTILNKIDNTVIEMWRKDIGANVIEIAHGNTTDRWLVVKRILDASQISLQAKSGVEVESTEIALAFPIVGKAKTYTQVLPEKRHVFAFLPLRSYGFRFVIQGDFDVPSSREDVDKDSVWNQWLRNEIPSAFIGALDSFKGHADFTQLEAVCSYLRFVPLEDEILDFFKPVATNILQQLKAKPCLPTGGLQWKLPSQLVICQDLLVREVVPSSMLKQHLSLDYLHRDVASVLNPLLIQNLGVQTLTVQHLIEIGKIIIAGYSNAAGFEKTVPLVSKWFVCIYRSLDEFAQNEDVLEILRSMVFIPCADGHVTSLQQMAVFFPLDSEENSKQNPRGSIQILQKDINTVHPSLFSCGDEVMTSQLRRLLEDIGVKKLTAHDIIHHHILPVFKGEKWRGKHRDTVMSYVIYIKECLDRQPTILNVDELAKDVVLLTNRGIRKPSEASVHLTSSFGKHIVDFHQMFPDYEWLLLDACYLQGCTSSQVQSWTSLLLKLGLIEHLSISKQNIVLTRDQLESSPWNSYREFLPLADTYHIDDYVCTEFNELVKGVEGQHSAAKSQEQMTNLYRVLEKNWDSHYVKFTRCHVCSESGQLLKDVETSLCMAIKNSQWIPSKETQMEIAIDGQTARMESVVTLSLGSNLYVDHPTISSVMGYHVSYARVSPSQDSSIAKFLGIKFRVSTDEVLAMLLKWCNKEKSASSLTVPVFAVVDHLLTVYEYLSEQLPPKRMQDIFKNHPIIFYTEEAISGHTLVKGQFLSREQVRWTDPLNVFAKHEPSLGNLIPLAFRKPIHHIYTGMERFFISTGQVQMAPSMEDFLSLLIEISATIPVTKALEDALKIYSFCGKQFPDTDDPNQLTMHDITLKSFMRKMEGKEVIPTTNKWASLGHKPMIADDKEYEKMFSEKEGVYFVDFGIRSKTSKPGQSSSDQDSIQKMFHKLGIPLLSECVDMISVTENFKQFPDLQAYVRNLMPYLQLYLHSEYEEIYQQHIARGTGESLAVMSFASVGKLEMVYSLKEMPMVVVIKTEHCQIIDDQQFCVHYDYMDCFIDLNKELARYFCLGDTQCYRAIRNFLTELQPLVDDPSPKLQALIRAHDLGCLSADEIKWEIPAPVYPRLLPPPAPVETEDDKSVEVMSEEPMDVEMRPSDGLLRSWPPRAGTAPMNMLQGSQSSVKAADKMWPPPKPPAHLDQSSLPANLRPSRYAGPRDAESANAESQDQDGKTIERSPADTPGRQHGPGCDSVTPHGPTRPRQPEDKRSDVTEEKRPGNDEVPGTQATSRASSPTADQETRTDDQPTAPVEENTTAAVEDMQPASGPPPDHKSPANFQRSDPSVPSVDSALPDDIDVADDSSVFEDPVVIEFHGYRQHQEPYRSLKRQRVDSGGRSIGTAPLVKRPVIFHGPPVWLEGAGEEVYEPVAEGKTLTLPESFILDSTSGQKDVGKWGEMLVNNYLGNALRKGDQGILKVNWMNEKTESGQPYDFVIQMTDGISDDVIETFIEVKSTLSDQKAFFEISAAELKFAMDKKELFHIFRVFNAGKPDLVRISKLKDLSHKMHTQQVRVAMVV